MPTFEASVRSPNLTANTGTYNVVFTTGSDGAVFTSRTVGFSGAAALANVYEAPVGVSGGTTTTSYNLNRGQTQVSTGVMLAGATVTGVGTQVAATTAYRGSTGNGQTVIGTFSTSASRRVLKPNTVYLLQFINNDSAAQMIDIYFQWTEGRP